MAALAHKALRPVHALQQSATSNKLIVSKGREALLPASIVAR